MKRVAAITRILLCTSMVLLCFSAHTPKRYLITNFGAVADSLTLNTKAIQNAIDQASAEGGGTIIIPKGTYLTGALFFKKGTTLQLEKGAVLKGSDDIKDYPFLPSRMEGQSIDYFAALINADNVDNFSIRGKGTIDGNGLKFWKQFWIHVDSMKAAGKPWTNLEVHRPRLVFISHSNHITIAGVKLHNAGFWTTHLYKCNNIIIENADIRSPFRPIKAPSTDAIDLDVCSHVIIRGCYMSVNDDAVTIKGGKGPYADQLPENGMVEDVLIENCTFGPSHGTVTFGSECIHGKNLTIRNCKLESDAPLLRLKLRPDTPQLYENITVENITGNTGVIISMKPWTQFFDLKGRKSPPSAIIRNITFRNVNVGCNRIGDMIGNPKDSVQNIVFENCRITTTQNADFSNFYGKEVRFNQVKVNGHLFILKD